LVRLDHKIAPEELACRLSTKDVSKLAPGNKIVLIQNGSHPASFKASYNAIAHARSDEPPTSSAIFGIEAIRCYYGDEYVTFRDRSFNCLNEVLAQRYRVDIHENFASDQNAHTGGRAGF
jgi:hypothetical protein